MSGKLYKVKIGTELMVMASDENEAMAIGKKNVSNEITEYGTGNAEIVNNLSNVPDNWKNAIPYGAEEIVQNKTCKDILQVNFVDDMTEDEVKTIIELNKIGKIGKKAIESKSQCGVLPETRPDPKPSKELEWKETQSGRPLPRLRLNIPKKN